MIKLSQETKLQFPFEKMLKNEDFMRKKKATSNVGRRICRHFIRGECHNRNCNYAHIQPDHKGEKVYVCKHWIRGLCKKGDDCEFLHEYNPEKMPPCQFFESSGECSTTNCRFLHIKKIAACPWYERGFCTKGPNCPNKHERKHACPDYMTGFCVKGPKCHLAHGKYIVTPDAISHAKRYVKRNIAPVPDHTNHEDNYMVDDINNNRFQQDMPFVAPSQDVNHIPPNPF